jgi:hypothetical protein
LIPLALTLSLALALPLLSSEGAGILGLMEVDDAMKRTRTTFRPLTKDECRELLFDYLIGVAKYWETDSRAKNLEDRMLGLVFSILSMIDGEHAGMPSFILSPNPHPQDKRFYKEVICQPWWPSRANLSGSLHDEFMKRVNRYFPVKK